MEPMTQPLTKRLSALAVWHDKKDLPLVSGDGQRASDSLREAASEIEGLRAALLPFANARTPAVAGTLTNSGEAVAAELYRFACKQLD
jgi:hypothetical protein